MIAVTAINSITHPVVFFGIMNLNKTYLQNILIAEGFVIAAEACYFKWLLDVDIFKAIAIAATANFVSWQLAPMMTYQLFG